LQNVVELNQPLDVWWGNYLPEQSGSFSRHARAGGHPAFSAKHFWIPAFAGMTSLEWKKLADPSFT
jgi:hypothetical protein